MACCFCLIVFTTIPGMGKECIRYHSRLAELIAAKKGEQYSNNFLDSSKDILCAPSVGPGLPSRIAGEVPYCV